MTLPKIKSIIDKQDQFLILVHTKPDGDALGSAYALLLYLLEHGKKAVIGLEERILEKYLHFIDRKDYQEHFVFYHQIKNWDEYQNIIVLDCSTPKLFGKYQDFVLNNKDRSIILDHHTTTESISDMQYVDSNASSASEIVFDLIEGKCYNQKMAKAIYMGIVFDTGQFRHSNTTSEVFSKIASILSQYPVSLEDTYYYLFENQSLRRKKVIAKLIEHTRLYANGKVAVGFIDNRFLKELQKEGFTPQEEDLIDLVPEIHSMAGVEVSSIVREKTDQITFSFRSRCDFNVAEFASLFGGGGHKKAAGLKIDYICMKDVEEKIIKRLESEFEQWLLENELH